MRWLLDRRLLLVLLSIVLLAACFGRNSRGRRGGETCFDNGDCNDETAAGEEVDLEACVDGECDDVDCLTSADCVVGQYCDNEDGDYACREGCQSDGDCFAGQSCEDGECEDYGCRSTILDCDFNEICNEDTGVCEQASGLQCTGCDPAANYRDDSGTPGNACDDTIGGNQFCGGDGSVCAGDALNAICWVACESPGEPDQCPAGFSCGFATWTPGIGCSDVALGPYCVPTDGCEPFSP